MRTGSGASPELLDALRLLRLDTVEGAFAYGGGEDLVKPGLGHRRRTRLAITDAAGQTHELYLKRYEREGLAGRLRRWVSCGVRTSPAGVEFDTIERVRAAGVATMQAVACGEQWGALDAERSYVIVTAVPGQKLESIVDDLVRSSSARPEVMRAFTLSLAQFVARLHRGGLVHRDLYAAHLFLDQSGGRMDWYLIDLARVFAPRWRRLRWRVKDLAQLKYSMPGDWAAGWWDEFIYGYAAGSGEADLDRLGRMIDAKVEWMLCRQHRKQAAKANAGVSA